MTLNETDVAPVVGLYAVIRGLKELGLNESRLFEEAGIPNGRFAWTELAPMYRWDLVWDHALRETGRPTIAFEAGLAGPRGSFGLFEYLCATAPTCGAGIAAIVNSWWALGRGRPYAQLGVLASGDLVVSFPGYPTESGRMTSEFLLGAVLMRLRLQPGAVERIKRLTVARNRDESLAYAALFPEAEVVSDAECPAFVCSLSIGDLVQPMAEPALHDVLRQAVEDLGAAPSHGSLEDDVMSSLRQLLPVGRGTSSQVASRLGMSERTLARRLSERGLEFRAILERFRIEESERRLRTGVDDFTDIASALGYSDQGTWARAFRRRTGMSPTSWLKRRAVRHEHQAPEGKAQPER